MEVTLFEGWKRHYRKMRKQFKRGYRQGYETGRKVARIRRKRNAEIRRAWREMLGLSVEKETVEKNFRAVRPITITELMRERIDPNFDRKLGVRNHANDENQQPGAANQ